MLRTQWGLATPNLLIYSSLMVHLLITHLNQNVLRSILPHYKTRQTVMTHNLIKLYNNPQDSTTDHLTNQTNGPCTTYKWEMLIGLPIQKHKSVPSPFFLFVPCA